MIDCKYNLGVICNGRNLYHDDAECDSCGWNPRKSEGRKRTIRRAACKSCAEGLGMHDTVSDGSTMGRCSACGKITQVDTYRVNI